MVYLASPFFNSFEEKVKEDMIEAAKKYFKGEDLYDPESAENNDDYGKGGKNSTKKDRYRFAKSIYLDNVKGIKNSSKLIFPKWTTDLGTLFEIGYALGLGNTIYRYNYLTQKVEKTPEVTIPEGPVTFKRYIANVSDAVKFGYLASKPEIADRLSYKLYNIGLVDNLMFAANFMWEDFAGNLIKPEDRDWEGIF